MTLESLNSQLEIAEMLFENYRGEQSFRQGLWKCPGSCISGDEGVDWAGKDSLLKARVSRGRWWGSPWRA